MVYDITNPQTLDDISSFWINEVLSYGEEGVTKLLIGNKSDDVENRCVAEDLGQALADTNNMLFAESSAKDGSNVYKSFEDLGLFLMKKKEYFF